MPLDVKQVILWTFAAGKESGTAVALDQLQQSCTTKGVFKHMYFFLSFCDGFGSTS